MRNGFTLIELIIVIAIIAIIASIIFPNMVHIINGETIEGPFIDREKMFIGKEVVIKIKEDGDEKTIKIRGDETLDVVVDGGALVVKDSVRIKKAFGTGMWKDFTTNGEEFQSDKDLQEWIDVY